MVAPYTFCWSCEVDFQSWPFLSARHAVMLLSIPGCRCCRPDRPGTRRACRARKPAGRGSVAPSRFLPGEDARAAWSTSSTRFGNHITVGCQLRIIFTGAAYEGRISNMIRASPRVVLNRCFRTLHLGSQMKIRNRAEPRVFCGSKAVCGCDETDSVLNSGIPDVKFENKDSVLHAGRQPSRSKSD